MKRLISLLLALTLVFALLCGCSDKKTHTEQEEGLKVTFNNDEGAIPQQTEPVEPLNKAVEKEELDFKGDHYGVIINGMNESEVKASKIDHYGDGADSIVVVPYYAGSKILLEKVTYDMETNGIVPTETLFEAIAPDDYALALKVNRPQGVMPEMRITVEYDGKVYSNLIKNVPDAETEYIR